MAYPNPSPRDITQHEHNPIPSMTFDPPDYEYSVLSCPNSVRLFVLLPWNDEMAPICGEILEHRLVDGEQQDYTALSYVWGKTQGTHELLIGDHRLRIGKNLFSALWNLRRRDRPIRLWVDALCINQLDVNERNHQVHQMRRIYSSAMETVAYIGAQTGSNTEYSAWNFLERNALWAMNENGDPDCDLSTEREELREFPGELADVEIDVLPRPWFYRLWVFQEVVVSKKLSIQCGERRVSWDDFCKALLLTPRHHDRYCFSIQRLDKVDVVRNMFQARCTYQERRGMGHVLPSWRSQVPIHKHDTLNALNLFQRARTLRGSDPRDKIFGLLGVCDGIDLSDQRFAIDYGQNCRTVYTKFARGIMETAKNYDALSYVDHTSRSQHELPSWVPNWDPTILDTGHSHDKLHTSRRTILSTLDPESKTARLERERLFDNSCGWIGSDEILVAHGSIIGKIESLSVLISLYRGEEMDFQAIRDSVISGDAKQRSIITNWLCYFEKYLHRYVEIDGDLFIGNLKLGYVHIQDIQEAKSAATQSDTFQRLLDECWSHDMKPPFGEGTVEHHLIARSRNTVSWTNSSAVTDTLIIDETSIVDGKRIAVYSCFGAPHVKALALVPASTREGDYLVDLYGGRVPFAMRIDYEHVLSHLVIDFGIRPCQLIGETVVNRVAVDNPTWCDRVFMIM